MPEKNETKEVPNILFFWISAAVMLQGLPHFTGQCMFIKGKPMLPKADNTFNVCAPHFFIVVTNK